MTILAWIVLAIVLLVVGVSVYAGCVAGGKADERAEREFREWNEMIERDKREFERMVRQAEREHDEWFEQKKRSLGKRRACPTCAHHLGAEQCRINAEGECREGGGYELWQPRV